MNRGPNIFWSQVEPIHSRPHALTWQCKSAPSMSHLAVMEYMYSCCHYDARLKCWFRMFERSLRTYVVGFG